MSDEVNHPAHYNQGSIETLDVWDAMGIGEEGCLSNIIKYTMRYRYKHKDAQGQLRDLQKARFYLDRIIEQRAGRLKEQRPADEPKVQGTMYSFNVLADLSDRLHRERRMQVFVNRVILASPLVKQVTAYDGGVNDALRCVRGCFLSDPSMLERIDQVINSLTT